MGRAHEQTDVGELMDRRARLRDEARTDGSAQDELDRVTEALAGLLAEAEPVVRLVPGDDPTGLARRLLLREPVHPLDPDQDLDAAVADRTDVDRRLVVLEHPLLPGRPMNVVWVALCRGVPASIDELLDPSLPALDPATADTAAFWSIWNAEPGLAGLGRGRVLIEGAIDLLTAGLPQLRTAVTLSPVPTLRTWLADRGVADAPGTERLLRDAARYLATPGPDGRPTDPVARFHLGNGASLWRVVADADRSTRGHDRSFGVMANYRYEPEDRAANRAALRDGRVATSPEVAALLS